MIGVAIATGDIVRRRPRRSGGRAAPTGRGGAAQKQLADAASRIAQSGLRPVRRRVIANARRLHRRMPSR
jgi:hypothetical protein